MQIRAGKRRSRLCQCRFEEAEIANASSPACCRDQPAMQLGDLTQHEVSHSGQTAVQVSVLAQDALGGSPKVVVPFG